MKTCPVCGIQFKPDWKQPDRQIYCSGICGKQSPKSILGPKVFHQLIFDRDNNQCQHKLSNGTICGSSINLEPHHIISIANGGTDSVTNLITWCRNCHRKHHARLNTSRKRRLQGNNLSE